MLEAADLTHTLLTQLGLKSFLKTSGGKGLHIVVPLVPRDDWDSVKSFSKTIANHLASVLPSRFSDISGKDHRVGKVFIDYMRNSRGAMTVAAFSTRARPGIGVSIPCSWDELHSLTGGAQWTVKNALERLESKTDPWEGYSKVKQAITAEAREMLIPRTHEFH